MLEMIFESVFTLFLLLILIPTLAFSLQVIGSLFFVRKSCQDTVAALPTTVVLIPAHNESIHLLPTLASVSQQAFDGLSVLVVADNCDDDTAAVARHGGAEVIERFNEHQRGKGFALDYGVQYLKQKISPEIVVILDADCLLQPDALVRLVRTAQLTSRPTQATYLMHAKPGAPVKTKIAEFAWMVKNWVRPQGLHVLGLPCQLMGSGMAFPWQIISQIDLATGHIVEDMKLGVDLAKAGHAPLFCPEALVFSEFPSNETGLKTQRTRWEHGHIGMLLKEGPGLLMRGLRQRSLDQIGLGLDLLIPPLALLILFCLTLMMLGLLMMSMASSLFPWMYGLVPICLISLSVMIAWAVYGRRIIRLSELMLIPAYIAAKLPLYLRFVLKRQSEWVRSKRD